MWFSNNKLQKIWLKINFIYQEIKGKWGEGFSPSRSALTAFHRHLADLLVMRVLIELHGTGEKQGEPGEMASFVWGSNLLEDDHESGDSLDHVHDLLAVVQPDVVVRDGHPLESHLKHESYLEFFCCTVFNYISSWCIYCGQQIVSIVFCYKFVVVQSLVNTW